MSYTAQNFINGSTVVTASWLNGVDEMVYNVLGGSSGQSTAIVLASLGLTFASGLTAFPIPIAEGGTGQATAATALAALGGTTLVAAVAGSNPQPTQTVFEAAAGIVPTSVLWPEGDIRRYGALTTLADNSAAINAALSVSSSGGAAAFIAPGTWNITSSMIAPPGSSAFGAGTTNSVIVVANGVDGLVISTGDSTYGGRTFRDFKILGTLSTTVGPNLNTNNAHGVYAVAAAFILNVLFTNVAVISFNWGFFISNWEDSTIFSCLIQNCWNGIVFSNQSANIFLLDNTINLVSPTTAIAGTGYSAGIECTGAPEIEGLHIQGGTLYGYDYNILLGLIFECQINAVDISNCTICPIYFTSEIGPLIIRDCWIELGAGASGVWNGGNANQVPGNLCGIFITAVTASAFSKVTIENNYVIADSALAGSTGIYVGDNNNGIVVRGNHVKNFDLGISGGNTLVNTGWALTGGTFTSNTINANTTAIAMNSITFNTELGPNYIVNGTPLVLTGGWPTSLIYEDASTPMSGTTSFAAVTSVAVVFANPLPTGSFQVSLSPSGTGTQIPGWGSKTANGFTIEFAAAFTGSVDWVVSL